MFPIKDNVPTRSFPIVTVTLIAINVAVFFLYEVPDQNRAVNELAFHPCEVERSCAVVGQDWPLTAVTSMFLHADLLHLGGNMLFLWIFGNNVEAPLSHLLLPRRLRGDGASDGDHAVLRRSSLR